jgi:hypothetical protein
MKRLFLLCSAFVVYAAHAQTLTESPTDDIWVYTHATSGQTDPFLRAWGDGVNSLDPAGYPPSFLYSYSYLKFDLGSIAAGSYQVSSATLTFTHAAPGYTLAQGEATPLEVRQLAPNFDEASWTFGNASNPQPRAVISTGSLANYQAGGEFELIVDLNTSGFETLFNDAITEGEIAFALTSAMNPGGAGGAALYKMYSKDDPGNRVPLLEIEYSPVPEPSTFMVIALGIGIAALARRRR